jgi:peroxiredoxin
MKKIYFTLCVVALSIFFSCKGEKQPSLLKTGSWRGVLTFNDSTDLILPFKFDVTVGAQNEKPVFITIFNGEEKIRVDEIQFTNDSIFIRMPVFDSEFRCRLEGDSSLTGNWINHARTEKNVIPFAATFGETDIYGCPDFDDSFDFNGKWKCVFRPTMPDSSYAIGDFKQIGKNATGTFLTSSGDYGYLQGCAFGKYMLLYNFDGAHAYIFHAEIISEDSMIWGEFYSGLHHHSTWIAWKNKNFQLPHPDSLTGLKENHSPINFNFTNTEGKTISLADERYKNKAVIVQIVGSWCPNCKDETQMLTDFYNQYQSQGLEVIGLAFEKTSDAEKAKANVLRLKNRFHSNYEFLISGYPPKEAEKALPFLNRIAAFPTTIFIDTKGVVRKIYTGYDGPATGKAHEKLVHETDAFIRQLLSEGNR